MLHLRYRIRGGGEPVEIRYTRASMDEGRNTLTVEIDPERYDITEGAYITLKDAANGDSYVMVPEITETYRQGYIVKSHRRYWCYGGVIRYEGTDVQVEFAYGEDGTVSGAICDLPDGSTHMLREASSGKWKRVLICKFTLSTTMQIPFDAISGVSERLSFTYDDGNIYEITVTGPDTGEFCDLSGNAHTVEFEDIYTPYSIGQEAFNTISTEGIAMKTDSMQGTEKYYTAYRGDKRVKEIGENDSVTMLVAECPKVSGIEGGNVITIRTQNPIRYESAIRSDSEGRYVLYNGRRLPVQEDAYRYAMIDGSEMPIIYDRQLSGTQGYEAHFEGLEGMRFFVREMDGQKHFEFYSDPNSPIFSGTPYSGDVFAVNGVKYGGIWNYEEDGKIVFVSDIVGEYYAISAGTHEIYLVPRTLDSDIDGELPEVTEMVREMVKRTLENAWSCVMEKGNAIEDFVFADDTNVTTEIRNTITLYSQPNSLTIPIPVQCDENNHISDEFRKKDLSVASLSVNGTVDMDRIAFEPCYIDGNGASMPVTEVSFSLHFRTRAVTETGWETTDQDNPGNSGFTGWFATDMYSGQMQSHGTELYESPDLLGFLGFTDKDVYYRKDRLSRSFLRLSYYDSTGADRRLIGYSTVFTDEKRLYSTFAANRIQGSCGYRRVNPLDGTMYASDEKSISVFSEPLSRNNSPSFDDAKRLGCGFSVSGRNSDSESSEGFSIYLYPDYVQGGYPQTIWMKCEYNHAGYGMTIPMMLPIDGDGKPLANIQEFKDNFYDGIPLSDRKKYEFIPLNIRYDAALGKYAYSYGGNAGEKMKFVLFETKYKDA